MSAENASDTASHPDPATELVNRVRNLLGQTRTGVMSSVDSAGIPRSRWMATNSFEEFPCLYTLTSAESRKVEHLGDHPVVSWMFTAPDMKFVVNLTGPARVLLEDAERMKTIWNEIADKSQAYFLGKSIAGPGFVIIETVVEKIECTFPESGRVESLDPRWIRPSDGNG